MTKPITADMTIAEILNTVPDAVELMIAEGLNCVGCGAVSFETLEDGMTAHGFSPEEIITMVAKIESLRRQKEAEKMHKPTAKDKTVEQIQEGNKTYHRIASMMFSQKAYNAIHDLANDKPGLQIRVEAGGCAGFSMKYNYAEKPQQDEETYPLSDTINLYINAFTFDKLYESVVDFESGLQGSGLKFINPNTKASCSCGTSVAF